MLNLRGLYDVSLIRDNRIIQHETGHNGIANDGVRRMLDIVFGQSSNTYYPVDPRYNYGHWYCGLIREKANLSATTLSASDTSSSHDFQIFTNIVEDTFPQWLPDTSPLTAGRKSMNSTPMTITIGSGTNPRLIGMYICNTNSKNSTDPSGWGILWASALFGPLTVTYGDVISITYTVEMEIGE